MIRFIPILINCQTKFCTKCEYLGSIVRENKVKDKDYEMTYELAEKGYKPQRYVLSREPYTDDYPDSELVDMCMLFPEYRMGNPAPFTLLYRDEGKVVRCTNCRRAIARKDKAKR